MKVIEFVSKNHPKYREACFSFGDWKVINHLISKRNCKLMVLNKGDRYRFAILSPYGFSFSISDESKERAERDMKLIAHMHESSEYPYREV